MQIVIDISDEDYQLMKDGHIPFNVLDAIRNGTTLSKIIDSLKELSKDHRHNYSGDSHEERAWRLGIEDSIDLILAESEDKG